MLYQMLIFLPGSICCGICCQRYHCDLQKNLNFFEFISFKRYFSHPEKSILKSSLTLRRHCNSRPLSRGSCLSTQSNGLFFKQIPGTRQICMNKHVSSLKWFTHFNNIYLMANSLAWTRKKITISKYFSTHNIWFA